MLCFLLPRTVSMRLWAGEKLAAVTKKQRPSPLPLSKAGAWLGSGGPRRPLPCGWRPVWWTSCQWSTQNSRSQPPLRSYWDRKIGSSGLWTPFRGHGGAWGSPGMAGVERKQTGRKGWPCKHCCYSLWHIFKKESKTHSIVINATQPLRSPKNTHT